jgi:hypothetical protein
MAGCTICLNSGPIEMHHTIPRSRGGEHSKQIPLCSNCHRLLHFKGLATLAKIRNPSKRHLNRKFWNSVEEEDRAQPYLEILVPALALPIPEGLNREHLISMSVSSSFFDEFKLLQLDLGLSSQEKVLEYCVQQMLQIRGIDNVTKESKNSELWFI